MPQDTATKLAWVIIPALVGTIGSGIVGYFKLLERTQEIYIEVHEAREKTMPRFIRDLNTMLDVHAEALHKVVETHGRRIDGLSSRLRRVENILMSGVTDGELPVEKEQANE